MSGVSCLCQCQYQGSAWDSSLAGVVEIGDVVGCMDSCPISEGAFRSGACGKGC